MEDLDRQFRPLLKAMSERAHRQVTVDGLVRAWSKLVADVEAGYKMSIYEYENDLDHRGLIQDLIDQGPESAVAMLRSEVEPLDARFEQVTRPVAYLVATFDKGPWAHRVPANPGLTLANDLRDREAEQR